MLLMAPQPRARPPGRGPGDRLPSQALFHDVLREVSVATEGESGKSGDTAMMLPGAEGKAGGHSDCMQ